MSLLITILLALLLAGCTKPVEKPKNLFKEHCVCCKQCGGGLLNARGEEQSLCDEGFRMFQEDVRKAWTTNTGPR